MNYSDVKAFFTALAGTHGWEFAHNVEHLDQKIGSGIKATDTFVLVMDEPRGRMKYTGHHYDLPSYGFWLLKKVPKGKWESEDTVYQEAKQEMFKVLGSLEYQKENEDGVFMHYDPNNTTYEKVGPETTARLFGVRVSIVCTDPVGIVEIDPGLGIEPLVSSSFTEEVEIIGGTFDITLIGDTWEATMGEDNALTAAIIAGLAGSDSGSTIADALDYTDVERVSDILLRFTIPPVAGYNLTADDTLSLSIPAGSTVGGKAYNVTVVTVKKAIVLHGKKFPSYAKYCEWIGFLIKTGQIDEINDNFYLGFSISKSSGNPITIVYEDGHIYSYPIGGGAQNHLYRQYGRSQSPIYLVTTDDWQGLTYLALSSSGFLNDIGVSIPREVGDMKQLANINLGRNELIKGLEDYDSIYNCPLKHFTLLNNGDFGWFPDERMRDSFDMIKYTTDATSLHGRITKEGWETQVNLQHFQLKNSNSWLPYEKGAFANCGVLTYVEFFRTKLNSQHITDLIIDLDLAGASNGTLIYTNLVGAVPTSEAYSSYINLVARGWTVSGPAPPAP